MSDAEQNATISDNEIDDLATPAEIEEVEAPRDTVEENGLDDDEDDLFGDGGDDEEEQPA
jgi:RNA polymerase-associated protein LEO1